MMMASWSSLVLGVAPLEGAGRAGVPLVLLVLVGCLSCGAMQSWSRFLFSAGAEGGRGTSLALASAIICRKKIKVGQRWRALLNKPPRGRTFISSGSRACQLAIQWLIERIIWKNVHCEIRVKLLTFYFAARRALVGPCRCLFFWLFLLSRVFGRLLGDMKLLKFNFVFDLVWSVRFCIRWCGPASPRGNSQAQGGRFHRR